MNFAWNYGDGTTGTGEETSHSYASPGSYTITLTATDPYNHTYTQTTTATISATQVISPPLAQGYISTPAGNIPNFGANPSDVAVQSGNWSSASTGPPASSPEPMTLSPLALVLR